MTKVGIFSLVVLGVLGVVACGDSEKKKTGGGSDRGGSGPAGAAGSGGASAGASGASAGGGGASGSAGAPGGSGGIAGSAGASAGSGGVAGDDGAGGEGDGGVGGEGGSSDPLTKATKLDVLFVVDNSISMYEKQQVLAQAVPTLVSRLVDPHCIFGDTTTTPAVNGTCPSGSVREIAPVRDMNVAVITSALGPRGGQVCTADPSEMPPRPLNDQAHVMGTVRTGLTSWNDSGFLKWDPAGAATPPGSNDVALFTSQLQAMIAAAGDRGCGYEAPLEAMRRFLVDPEPWQSVGNDGQFTTVSGVDTTLLDQRAAFLRPDSAVLIVLLSDEDDCSINTEPNAQGWLVGTSTFRMPRGSDACARPDDPNIYRCCIPCVLLDSSGFTPAQGCDYSADVACNNANGHSRVAAEDSVNLRCYRQTERFGLNLLYPIDRYVSALKGSMTVNRAGVAVPNPLFAGGRDPRLVVLTTIVGVPWQDLVIETEKFDGYELMSAQELRTYGRFPVILGDYDANIPPTDPFMIDSIAQRSGSNPLTGQSIMPPTAASNATINGHEYNIVNNDDLQYACTFPLPEPIPCTTANQDGCDCNASEQAYSRPTCEYPGPGMDGTQVAAKAYPGRRELEVARRMGDQAVLASICPRTLEDEDHPAYGYVPVMRAIQREVRRILAP